ncbi:hypothetical protein M0813_25529 [Anaeramoeba flamelloides]|uniref:Uncharacterized protein n=1 Tax=Anaeramoeba flamelloides TaxID=1746091 RepID=A0ABQ8Y270_9EUKA|nr:hypothetical protein M0813_25529 [Anaeramoeba flamelloides]
MEIVDDVIKHLEEIKPQIFIPKVFTDQIKKDLTSKPRNFVFPPERLGFYLILPPPKNPKTEILWLKGIPSLQLEVSVAGKIVWSKDPQDSSSRPVGQFSKTVVKSSRKTLTLERPLTDFSVRSQMNGVSIFDDGRIVFRKILILHSEPPKSGLREKEKYLQNFPNNHQPIRRNTFNSSSIKNFKIEAKPTLKPKPTKKKISRQTPTKQKKTKLNEFQLGVEFSLFLSKAKLKKLFQLSQEQTQLDLNEKSTQEIKSLGFSTKENLPRIVESLNQSLISYEKKFTSILTSYCPLQFDSVSKKIGHNTFINLHITNNSLKHRVSIISLDIILNSTKQTGLEEPNEEGNVREGIQINNPKQITNFLQILLDKYFYSINLSKNPLSKKSPQILLPGETSCFLFKISPRNLNNSESSVLNNIFGSFKSLIYCSWKTKYQRQALLEKVPIFWSKTKGNILQIRLQPQTYIKVNHESTMKIEIINSSENLIQLNLKIPLEQNPKLSIRNEFGKYKKDHINTNENDYEHKNKKQKKRKLISPKKLNIDFISLENSKILNINAKSSIIVNIPFIPLKEGLLEFKFQLVFIKSGVIVTPERKIFIFVRH